MTSLSILQSAKYIFKTQRSSSISLLVTQPLAPTLCNAHKVTFFALLSHQLLFGLVGMWSWTSPPPPPPDLGEDCVLALQPRSGTPMPKSTSCFWPEPQSWELSDQNGLSQHCRQALSHWSPRAPQPGSTYGVRTITCSHLSIH